MPLSSESVRSYHHGDLRRALVDAALAIVAEDQNWEFSLREVARRAGVSHNAPYRHFNEKLDLLAAIAKVGFDTLGSVMKQAVVTSKTPDDALIAIGNAYVRFGTENPARYRLMFSSVLSASKATLPTMVAEAAVAAQQVLIDVVADGIRENRFRTSFHDTDAHSILALSAWATVHGLTMLIIDGLAEVELSPRLPAMIGGILLDGIISRSIPPTAAPADRNP